MRKIILPLGEIYWENNPPALHQNAQHGSSVGILESQHC